jgi:hypothetical protein
MSQQFKGPAKKHVHDIHTNMLNIGYLVLCDLIQLLIRLKYEVLIWIISKHDH